MKKQWINTLIWTGVILGAIGIALLVMYILLFKTVLFLVMFATFIVVSVAYVIAKNSPIYKIDENEQ